MDDFFIGGAEGCEYSAEFGSSVVALTVDKIVWAEAGACRHGMESLVLEIVVGSVDAFGF